MSSTNVVRDEDLDSKTKSIEATRKLRSTMETCAEESSIRGTLFFFA